MNRLNASEITTLFNKGVASADNRNETALQMLREISLAVADMQSAGLDVAIDVFNAPCSQAFNLVLNSQDMLMPYSGILYIAGQQHLFGLVTRQNDSACKKLFLSCHDIRFHQSASFVHSHSFNLMDANGTGIIEFQKTVIKNCSKAAIIADNDPGRVFEKTPVKAPKQIFRK